MKKEVAKIDLTVQEMANAVAERISHMRLTKSNFWNSYTLQIKVHNGELEGATVRYYLEDEEASQEAKAI